MGQDLPQTSLWWSVSDPGLSYSIIYYHWEQYNQTYIITHIIYIYDNQLHYHLLSASLYLVTQSVAPTD